MRDTPHATTTTSSSRGGRRTALPFPQAWAVAAARAQPEPPAGAARPAAGRGRILIAEDDWLISSLIEQILLASGFTAVAVAADAATAVAIAGRERPDLVLMDIRLADGSDGVDAAREIADRYGIRSLFVSAHTDQGTVARALAAGPAGWLPKPFTESELLQAVADALGVAKS